MENQDRSLIISDQPSPLERREEGRIVVVREKDDADLRDAFSQFEAQLYPVHAVGKLDIEEGDVGVHPRRVLEARRTVLITPDDFDFVMLGEDGDKHPR